MDVATVPRGGCVHHNRAVTVTADAVLVCEADRTALFRLPLATIARHPQPRAPVSAGRPPGPPLLSVPVHVPRRDSASPLSKDLVRLGLKFLGSSQAANADAFLRARHQVLEYIRSSPARAVVLHHFQAKVLRDVQVLVCRSPASFTRAGAGAVVGWCGRVSCVVRRC